MIRLMHVLSVSILFALNSLGVHQSAFAETIILAADGDYAPFEIDPPINGLQGTDTEVVGEAFKRVGVTVDFQFMPWSRATELAKRGKVAGMLSCYFTEERLQFFQYPDPISESTDGFWMRKDFTGRIPQELADVRGLKTGGIFQNASFTELQSVNPNAFSFPTQQMALKRMMAGSYDYLYQTKETVGFVAKGLQISDQLKFAPVKANEHYVCFSKRWPDISNLIERFNKGLAEVRADGTFEAIHSKYR